MDSDCKGIFLVFLGLVLVASAIAWPIAWYNYSVTAEAMRNGYERQAVPGSATPQWVKPSERRR